MSLISEIAATVKSAAHAAGFDLSGIAPATDAPEQRYFPEWIAAGHAGEMRYMEARDEQGALKRESLAHVAPWARSVVVCAINYNTAQPYSNQVDARGRGYRADGRNARYDQYGQPNDSICHDCSSLA